MRRILILFSCGFFLFSCLSNPQKERAVIAVTNASLSDTINFESSVQPIFEMHCRPCHFPGGKMYDKMPFDKSETILQHSEGIFKRIKNEKELELLKQFLKQRRDDH